MSLENSIQLSSFFAEDNPSMREQEILQEPVAPPKADLGQYTANLDTPPSGKKRLVTPKPSLNLETWNLNMDQNEMLIDDLFPEARIELVEDPENTADNGPNQVNTLWSGDSIMLTQNDEFACYNPFEVEGLEKPSVTTDNTNEAVQREEDFDLLDFVVNDAIDPNDPQMKAFIDDTGPQLITVDLSQLAPSTSAANSTTVTIKEEPTDDDPDYQPEPQVIKRGRGRPRIPRADLDLPRRPRGRPPTAAIVATVNEYDSSSNFSSDEIQEIKYRRMRDLNNAASKRCRINRKRKFEVMEVEEEQQRAKNAQLKAQVEHLESQVANAKKVIMLMVKKKRVDPPVNVAPAVIAPLEVVNEPPAQVLEDFDIDALLNTTIDEHNFI